MSKRSKKKGRSPLPPSQELLSAFILKAAEKLAMSADMKEAWETVSRLYTERLIQLLQQRPYLQDAPELISFEREMASSCTGSLHPVMVTMPAAECFLVLAINSLDVPEERLFGVIPYRKNLVAHVDGYAALSFLRGKWLNSIRKNEDEPVMVHVFGGFKGFSNEVGEGIFLFLKDQKNVTVKDHTFFRFPISIAYNPFTDELARNYETNGFQSSVMNYGPDVLERFARTFGWKDASASDMQVAYDGVKEAEECVKQHGKEKLEDMVLQRLLRWASHGNYQWAQQVLGVLKEKAPERVEEAVAAFFPEDPGGVESLIGKIGGFPKREGKK